MFISFNFFTLSEKKGPTVLSLTHIALTINYPSEEKAQSRHWGSILRYKNLKICTLKVLICTFKGTIMYHLGVNKVHFVP